MYLINKNLKKESAGGKAYNLFSLNIKKTPSFFVIESSYFEEFKKNPSIEKELEKEINSKLKDNKKYAVRSSGIDEDSDLFSFAGIHDSFLNIAKKDVLDNIKKVYQSAFSQIALDYRKKNNIQSDKILMAVMVQEMIDPNYAGVINTINPITNNPDEIVISVIKGLGEDLVNGNKNSSDYFVNGFNYKVQGEDILNKKQIHNLIDLARLVAKKTTSFQDIEFAIVKNKVFLLQARPISAYKNINPHRKTFFIDNSNIIESYYGVTTPLTFSFALDIYRQVYQATLKAGKVRSKIMNSLKDSLANMLYYHEGKIYYNMKNWYRLTSIFPFKKSTTYMENMMGVKSASDDYTKVSMNLIDLIKLLFIFLNKVKNIDSLSEKFIDKFNQVVLPYYGKEIKGTNLELNNLYQQIENNIISDFATPIINDCAVMIYFGRLKEKIRKSSYSNKDEILNACINNSGNVESLKSASKFVELADLIKSNQEALIDFLSLNGEELYQKYQALNNNITQAIEKYRYDFGPRVVNELKLETITWIEKPDDLYAYLSSYLKESQMNINYPPKKEIQIPKEFIKLGKKAKHYIQNREQLRLKRTYIFSVVRNIFLAYGQNFYKEGVIDDPRDIFYLTKEEIQKGVDNPKSLIKKRKEEEKDNQEKPIYDRINFYENGVVLPILSSNSQGDLKGIPSGAGIIKGKVRMMNTAKDYLQKDEIILTKRTDPGWISLFPLASGLIVEHGSMLSHSMVVAREMGLPAVVGVKNATERLKTGDRIILDGIIGEIKFEKEGM